VVSRAVTSPGSLFLVTTGLLLGLTPETWAFGAGFLAAEGALIWWRVRDPRHAGVCSEEMLRQRWRGQLNRLEEVATVLDRETAAALSAIVEAQERLLALYGDDTTALPHSRVELTTLLEHCLSLAEKKQQIQTYLAVNRGYDIQRQVYQLQLRIEQSSDPVTIGLYEQAIEQKRQELENYGCLEEAITRIDGQLAAVQCTFDNLIGKLVRLRSAESVAGELVTDPLFADLQRLSTGVVALEDSLNEILVARTTP
jgi:hypothetical protein